MSGDLRPQVTDDERLAQIREMDEDEILNLLDRTAAQAEAALNHQIEGEHVRLEAAQRHLEAAQNAHEFAHKQHIETFKTQLAALKKLQAVDAIVRREDYADLYDLMNDLRTALDA
jgi:hypothetical protein